MRKINIDKLIERHRESYYSTTNIPWWVAEPVIKSFLRFLENTGYQIVKKKREEK